MSNNTEVTDWLRKKFPTEDEYQTKLVEYIASLYPDAKSTIDIEKIYEESDAKLKAYYLIALSALAIKNTNLRNALPGPLFTTLSADDFNAKTQRVKTIASNNNSNGWPNPKNLFEDKDTIKSAVSNGSKLLERPLPKNIAGYEARLGSNYGIDPTNNEENVYRFEFLQQPLTLQASKTNNNAVNELLFLTKNVRNFPKKVHDYIVEAFRNTGGKFDKNNQPVIVDLKPDQPSGISTELQQPPPVSEQKQIDKKLADEAMEFLGKPVQKKVDVPSEKETDLASKIDEKDKEIEGLKKESKILSEKTVELEKKLVEVESGSKQSLENVRNQLQIVQRNAEECSKLLQSATNDTKTAQTEATKLEEKLKESKTTLDRCQAEVQGIAQKTTEKFENAFRLMKKQLDQRQEELLETKKQLDMCRLDSNVVMSDKKALEKNVQEKIASLEQTRAAGLSSLEAMKTEKSKLESQLLSAVSNIRRIAQLKQKCSTQGKTMVEQLGEVTAKKLDNVEASSAISKNNVESLLADLNQQIADVSEKLSTAYETECQQREKLLKLQTEQTADKQKEVKLQQEVDEKTQLVEQLQQQLQTAQAESGKTATLLTEADESIKKLQSDLQKNMEQYQLVKQNADAQLGDLQKQVRNLLQETRDLVLKNNDCQAKYEAVQQASILKMRELETKLTKKLETKAAEEKQALAQQIEKLTNDNAQLLQSLESSKIDKKEVDELQKQLNATEKLRNKTIEALQNREEQLKECKQTNAIMSEAAEEKHNEFIASAARMIAVSDIDADAERYSRIMSQFDNGDRETVRAKVEQIRSEGSIPKAKGAKVSELQQRVSELQKELQDAQGEAKRVTEERQTLSDELAKALKEVAVFEAQKSNETAATKLDDEEKAKLRADIAAREAKITQLQQKGALADKNIVELQNTIQDLQNANTLGEEALEKCKQKRDEYYKNLETTETTMSAQIKELQAKFNDATRQLEAMPKVDENLMSQMRDREQKLSSALEKSELHLKDLQTEVELLLKQKDVATIDKQKVENNLNNQIKRVQEVTKQLEESQKNVQVINAQLLEMDAKQKSLQQLQSKCVQEFEKLKKDSEYEIGRVGEENAALREQIKKKDIENETDKTLKTDLEQKLAESEKRYKDLAGFLTIAKQTIEELNQQVHGINM